MKYVHAHTQIGQTVTYTLGVCADVCFIEYVHGLRQTVAYASFVGSSADIFCDRQMSGAMTGFYAFRRRIFDTFFHGSRAVLEQALPRNRGYGMKMEIDRAY